MSLKTSELLHILALKKAIQVGDATAKKLINLYGSATEVFAQSDETLSAVEGIGALKLKSLRDKNIFKIAEAELKFIEENDIDYCTFLDPEYPRLLGHCVDGPIVLFKRGNINFIKRHILSIVGTRQVTTYGQDFIEKLLKMLQPYDPLIVSGFAYGVDIYAQRLATDLGLQTVGVLAHGLNQIYPKTHAKYMSAIEANGGFMTDFFSSDTFDRKNFLGRNRIIAGLSPATVVIESAEKGGSLVTAELADGYNREVFALPGRITDKFSSGCNDLIKRNKALPITTPADVPYILNWELETAQKSVQAKLFVELDDTERKIFSYLAEHGKELMDIIAIRTGIPTHTLASVLFTMEMKGVLRPLPGKYFELVP